MKDVSRQDIEDFLYREAALLDAWDLDAWEQLFVPDGVYRVPNPGNPPDASPEQVVYFIADTREAIHGRVERLKKINAHVEHPRSKTLHNVSNVRLIAREGRYVTASCHIVVYRTRQDVTDTFFGRAHYRLSCEDVGLRIVEKTFELALGALRDQSKISIIL